MVNPMHDQLSRRENQIMDVVYQLGEATAVQILERLPDPPSNSAIRTLLTILEEKGHLTHRRVRGKFVYSPSIPADNARRSALSQLLRTFFGGSPPQMVAAILSSTDLSDAELDELADLIQKAKAQEKEDENESTADHE